MAIPSTITAAVILFMLGFVGAKFVDAKPSYPEPQTRVLLAVSSQQDTNAFTEVANALTNYLQAMQEGESEDDKTLSGTSRKFEDEEEIDEKSGASDNPNMFGDLLLTAEQENILLNEAPQNSQQGHTQGFLIGARLWPNGVVPYDGDRRLNSQARRVIRDAMSEFQRRSCLRFVHRRRRNSQNYVYFTPENGCFSALGMVGGRQTISIGRGCEHKGIVQHEIFHALGRVHEQSRPDRDQFVIINKQNIRRGLERNFDIMRANTGNVPYDYGSVMHYAATAFSANGQPTITTRQPARIGQRWGLSSKDWRHVQNYCSHVGKSGK